VDGGPAVILAVEVDTQFLVDPFQQRQEVILRTEVDEGEGLVVQTVPQHEAMSCFKLD